MSNRNKCCMYRTLLLHLRYAPCKFQLCSTQNAMEFSVCYEHDESKKWQQTQPHVFSRIYFLHAWKGAPAQCLCLVKWKWMCFQQAHQMKLCLWVNAWLCNWLFFFEEIVNIVWTTKWTFLKFIPCNRFRICTHIIVRWDGTLPCWGLVVCKLPE